MQTILVFDQAESAGGSINRAVDLAEALCEFHFIFLTFHSLKKLGCPTSAHHISTKHIFSFYNGKKAALHNQWIQKHIPRGPIQSLLQSLAALASQANKLFVITQAFLVTAFTKIDIVQANCGFHPLPYHLALRKKAVLIYYFRDLQDYSRINPAKIKIASQFIFVSNVLKQQYFQQLSLPQEKCRMIHSPFDVHARIKKEQVQDTHLIDQLKRNNKKIIVLVARICKDKGQHIALAAVNILKNSYQNFALLIVGEADPDSHSRQYLNELYTYISVNNLNNYVYFLGYRHDVLHLVQCADISLQTPIYFEAMSGATIESLQLGVVTVSSDAGGACEAISDKASGFIFPKGDYSHLANLLLEILNEKFDLSTIANNGKIHATEEWSAKKIQHQMRDIYSNI